MKLRVMPAFFWLLSWGSLVLIAGEEPHRHRILLAQYQGPGGNRLIEVSADGKLTWEHKVPSLCAIFQALPNHPIVYGYGVGNFVIGNFLRGQEGKGAHAFGTNLCWPEPLPAVRDLQPAMIGDSRNSTA